MLVMHRNQSNHHPWCFGYMFVVFRFTFDSYYCFKSKRKILNTRATWIVYRIHSWMRQIWVMCAATTGGPSIVPRLVHRCPFRSALIFSRPFTEKKKLGTPTDVVLCSNEYLQYNWSHRATLIEPRFGSYLHQHSRHDEPMPIFK